MIDPVLSIRNLRTYFYTYEGVARALDGVDLELGKEEVLGLVGETGCGKSVTALSIMRLVSWPPGKILEGKILFKGEDLLSKTESQMEKIRGRRISMIFQEPTKALNPVLKVGDQIADVLMAHQKMSKKEASAKAVELIRLTGMPDPEMSSRKYPHELSGGMKQRLVIAMAVSCDPEILIADEPTTHLDVTIQAQILDLMRNLRQRIRASMLLITHNLGLVATQCSNVAVMYAGVIVEEAKVAQIFRNPQHPYTIGLLNSVPKLSEKKERLDVIRGSVPNVIDPPTGCSFHPRCLHAMDICSQKKPSPKETSEGHRISCFLF